MKHEPVERVSAMRRALRAVGWFLAGILAAYAIWTLMQAGWFVYSKFFRKTPTE